MPKFTRFILHAALPGGFALALVLSLLLSGQPAFAISFVVDDLGDSPDAALDGVCSTGDGMCTLRAAVEEANAQPGDDTITFSVSGTVVLESALPALADNGALTIDGGGLVTVSGADMFRVLSIDPGAHVDLDGLTISDGSTGEDFGAGIFNGGILTLTNSTVADNVALIRGGGIYNDTTGMVTISSSTVSGNSAAQGGGIYSLGGLTVSDGSTFANNSALFYTLSYEMDGGGIYSAGTLSISGSSFSGNHADFRGGGVLVLDGGGAISSSTFANNTAVYAGALQGGLLTISDSTFYGNAAVAGPPGEGGAGGAVQIAASTIINCTFYGNTASTGSGGAIYAAGSGTTIISSTITGNSAFVGGGIRGSAAFYLSNSLVAGNTGTTGGPDIYTDYNHPFTSQGFNLIGSSADAQGFDPTDLKDSAAAPLNLGTLADNGGPTLTIALLPGSVALNRGNPTTASSGFDQRGAGYTRVQAGRIDIGAYEAPGTCPTFPASIASGDSDGLIRAIDCANSDAADNVINLAGGSTYTLTAINSRVPADGYSGLPPVLNKVGGGKLTINGNGSTITRSAALAFRIFSANYGADLTLVNLTVSNGSSGSGGGILGDHAILRLNTVTFSGNVASDLGGGLFNNLGTVIVTGGAFSSNTSDYGGGIYSSGTLSMSGSTFSGNVANLLGGALASGSGSVSLTGGTMSGNHAGEGGGIYNYSGSSITLTHMTIADNAAAVGGAVENLGTLSINSSTLSGNTANDGAGGGIYSFAPSATISNSTVSGNSASGNGGGIYNGLSLSLQNSTIANNTSDLFGGGVYAPGGSITTSANTLIATNSAAVNPDFSGTLTSQGYNLVGDSSGATGFVTSDLKDALAAPLNLGALTDNGGTTQTMALMPGSVAIDRGDPAFSLALDFDQRGTGYPRIRGSRLDIGAYETPGADLTIHLNLQGRPTPPSAQWVTGVHIEVRVQGGTPVRIGDYVSDPYGQFVIPELPVGTFNVWIKELHSAAQVQTITLNPGASSLSTALLKEGDADDSNSVTITDFAILAAAFGKSSVQPGYDARADFNGDSAVTITDFSLLALNFGQTGAP